MSRAWGHFHRATSQGMVEGYRKNLLELLPPLNERFWLFFLYPSAKHSKFIEPHFRKLNFWWRDHDPKLAPSCIWVDVCSRLLYLIYWSLSSLLLPNTHLIIYQKHAWCFLIELTMIHIIISYCCCVSGTGACLLDLLCTETPRWGCQSDKFLLGLLNMQNHIVVLKNG